MRNGSNNDKNSETYLSTFKGLENSRELLFEKKIRHIQGDTEIHPKLSPKGYHEMRPERGQECVQG